MAYEIAMSMGTPCGVISHTFFGCEITPVRYIGQFFIALLGFWLGKTGYAIAGSKGTIRILLGAFLLVVGTLINAGIL